MAKLRPRYVLIDKENAMMREVGLHVVLNPAKNPADYAALLTLAENVEPEFAADIMDHLHMIDQYPNRGLGSYAMECLPHIKHPAVKAFAERRLAQAKAKGRI